MHTAKQGETAPATFIVMDEETGQPLDLTGSTVSARARLQKGTSPGYNLSSYIQEPTTGRVACSVADLPVGVYNLEFKIDAPAGTRFAPSDRYEPIRILERV